MIQRPAIVVAVDGKFAVAQAEEVGHPMTVGNGRFDTLDQATRIAEGLSKMSAPLYTFCPGCSGDKAVSSKAVKGDDLFECVSCGALFGRVLDPNDYINLDAGLVEGGARFYFDFTVPVAGFVDKVRRTHGWTDADGNVVQFG